MSEFFHWIGVLMAIFLCGASLSFGLCVGIQLATRWCGPFKVTFGTVTINVNHV